MVLAQVGFGSGFKCNSAVWTALRTVNSKHAAWKHLDANTSTEQDSKLRVENNTAAESNGSADKANKQEPVHSRQNGDSDASEDVSDKENNLCNGHSGLEQETKATVKNKEGDVFANGDPHLADSKAGKNGQIKHQESSSGEIKAHSHLPNGKQAVAFL